VAEAAPASQTRPRGQIEVQVQAPHVGVARRDQIVGQPQCVLELSARTLGALRQAFKFLEIRFNLPPDRRARLRHQLAVVFPLDQAI